ncbi:hypothetical protein [Streptomyces sp. NPDC096012]|uniref:hypothetical protein n=1 Tax=Streptomyces sp. NPDC096012 TaxID=3155684 RepID=UPI00336A7003
MNKRPTLIFVALSLLLVACGRPTRHQVPPVLCGTRVDPQLTHALVQSGEEWHEYNRVDRTEAITAPCLVVSGQAVALKFRFSWRSVATDLMYLATDTGTVSGVANPRSINFKYKTLVGSDGAISQAPCKTKRGRYFTLTLQVPRIRVTDQSHRKDIEKFMRAYFPATVRTLHCA